MRCVCGARGGVAGEPRRRGGGEEWGACSPHSSLPTASSAASPLASCPAASSSARCDCEGRAHLGRDEGGAGTGSGQVREGVGPASARAPRHAATQPRTPSRPRTRRRPTAGAAAASPDGAAAAAAGRSGFQRGEGWPWRRSARLSPVAQQPLDRRKRVVNCGRGGRGRGT